MDLHYTDVAKWRDSHTYNYVLTHHFVCSFIQQVQEQKGKKEISTFIEKYLLDVEHVIFVLFQYGKTVIFEVMSQNSYYNSTIESYLTNYLLLCFSIKEKVKLVILI